MSENLDLVRAICDQWQSGDFGRLTWADAEIELVFADGPRARASRGLRAMLQAWRGAVADWESFRVAADGYREIDSEHVLVTGRSGKRDGASGQADASGECAEAFVFRIRAGRVVGLAVYLDRDNALVNRAPRRLS